MLSDRALYELTPAMLHTLDAEGRLVAVSNHWLTVMGYPREAVLGQPITAFITDIADTAPMVDGGEASESYPVQGDRLCQLTTKDGIVLWGKLTHHAVQDATGALINTLAAVVDIAPQPGADPDLAGSWEHLESSVSDRTIELHALTQALQREIHQRRELEHALRHREDHYRATFHHGAVGVVNTTPEGKFVDCNPRFCEMLGYTEAELQRLTVWEVTYPDDRLIYAEQFNQLMAGAIPHLTVEKRYCRKDGTSLRAEATVSLVRDTHGVPRFATAVVQDIGDRKQAEMALRESEARFRLIAETIQDVFWIDDAKTFEPIYSSPGFEQIWGFPPEQIGEDVFCLNEAIHPEDRDRMNALFREKYTHNTPFQAEYRICHPDGTVRWVYERGFPAMDTAGNQLIVGVTKDITAGKIAELALRESEARFQQIANTIEDVFWVSDTRTHQTIYVNPAFERVWGISCEAVYANPDAFVECVHPEDRDRVRAALYAERQGTAQFNEEYRICRPDGTLLWVHDRGFGSKSSGNPHHIVGIATDITAHKQTEEALRRYERLVAANSDRIVLIDLDYRYQIANPAFLAWRNLEPIDVIGQTVATIVGTEAFHSVIQARLDRALAGETTQYEERFDYLGFEHELASVTYAPYREADGTLSGVVVSIRDITALHEAQAALQEANHQLRSHIQNSPLAVVEWDSQVCVKGWTGRAEAIFGWLADEVIGQHFTAFPLVHPEDLPEVTRVAGQLVRGEASQTIVLMRHLTKTGQIGHSEWYSSALRDEAGNLISILSLVQDVSDRNRAQAALRQSEERWQLALQGNNDGIWDWNPRTQELFLSPRCKAILGYGEDELENTYEVWESRLHPEDRSHVLATVQAHLQGEADFYHAEYRIRCKDGSYRWVLDRGQGQFDAAGQPVRVVGSLSDISDRKQAEANLHRYVQMVEAATDGICLLDHDYRYQITNRTYDQWYGDDKTPILGQTVAEVLGQAAFDHRLKAVLDQCWRGETVEYARWFKFPRWGWRFRSVTCVPFVEPNGDISGIVTSIRDLTSMKEAQAKQQELLEIIEATPDYVGMFTPAGEIVYLNPALTVLLGDRGMTAVETTGFAVVHPPWAQAHLTETVLPHALQYGTWQGESALLAPDGSEIPVAQTVTLHRDEFGRVKLLSTIAHDIRDRQRMEQQLRDRLQFEQIISHISTQIVDLPESGLNTVIQGALSSVGSAIGAECGFMFWVDDHNIAQLIEQCSIGSTPLIFDPQVPIPLDPYPWMLTRLRNREVIAIANRQDLPPEADAERQAMVTYGEQAKVMVAMTTGQKLIGLLGFVMITRPKDWLPEEIGLLQIVADLFASAYERHQAEIALDHQRHYFRALTEQSSDIVVILNPQGVFQYVTPSATRLLGYAPEDILGHGAVEFVHPEDAPLIFQVLQQAAMQPAITQPLVQYRMRHHNGTWRTFEATTTSLLHDPIVQGVVVNCRDVSDRVQAQTALRLSEQRFRAIFEQSAIGMTQVTLDGTYRQVNEAFCSLTGRTAEALHGIHWQTITHPDDWAHDGDLTQAVSTGQMPAATVQKRFVHPSGQVRIARVVMTAVCNPHGVPEFLACIYEDITDRVATESALQSIVEGTAAVTGEDFFPALAQHLSSALGVDYVMVNQLIGTHLTTLAFSARGELQEPLTYAIAQTPCEATILQGFYYCPSGVTEAFPEDPDLRQMEAESYLGIALVSDRGEIMGEVCVIDSKPLENTELTTGILRTFAARVTVEMERQRSSRALRESEARLWRILDNMPILLDAVDENGILALWNQECERVTGYSAKEMVGNPEAFALLYPDADSREAMLQTWAERGNNYRDLEWTLTCKDGSERIIAWSNVSGQVPIPGWAAWGIGVDVTERRRTENALRQSEARFQRLAENLPGIVYRYHIEADGRDHLSYVSPACRDLWELEPEAACRDISLVRALIHPEDLDSLRASMAEALERMAVWSKEYRMIIASGQMKWMRAIAKPVAQPDGSFIWDGVIVDVTESKRIEQALRDSEAINRAMLNAIPDLMFRMRRDGVCLDIKHPGTFPLLHPLDHYIGHNFRDILPLALAEQHIAAAATVLDSQGIQIYEFQIQVNGEDRWEEARVVPSTSDEVLILIRDVSDRRQAEAALRQSEAMNRAILEAMPDLIVRMRQDGYCIDVRHPSSFPMVVSQEKSTGRYIQDMLAPAVVEQRLAATQRALETGQIQITEFQIPLNGYSRWEESRIVPLAQDEVLVLVRDVDERKRAEEEVRRLNQQLEAQNQQLEDLVEQRTAELLTFINALPDQIFVVERDTMRMPFCNHHTAAITLYGDRKLVAGKSLFDCFAPGQAAYYAAQNRQVFESGETLHVEESLALPTGKIHLDTYKIPLKRPDGTVYALIGTSRDITELVNTREALKVQTAQLEITNRELESFSYSVSHDLRAPLRHINGFIVALRQRLGSLPQEDAKIAHYLGVIAKSSERMGQLIDGLLTLSRVGRREMSHQRVALASLVENTLSLLEVPLSEPDRLVITVEPLPTVQGDPTLLQQVFTNLLDNALKFSRDRTPARITVGCRPDGTLFVQDNGVGFDMVYADKLFSPFQRLHSQENFQGTGIGLAIVQRIIHRHGGTIWVESVPEQGTQIFFTLAMEEDAPGTIPAAIAFE